MLPKKDFLTEPEESGSEREALNLLKKRYSENSPRKSTPGKDKDSPLENISSPKPFENKLSDDSTPPQDERVTSKFLRLSKDKVRRLLENKELQRLLYIKSILFKVGLWLLAIMLIVIGHFWTAMFVLFSATFFYRELIKISRVNSKEEKIEVVWIDWYYYGVGAYICIPSVFMRP